MNNGSIFIIFYCEYCTPTIHVITIQQRKQLSLIVRPNGTVYKISIQLT